MVSQKIVITNGLGLHLRPAKQLCQEALKFQCKITFKTKREYEGNAKSVLSVLAGGVKCNDEIELCCQGEDEKEALSHLIQLIEHGLGE